MKTRIIEHQWIPMGDGVRLSVRLWLPETSTDQPAPAVLEYIPYRKRDLYRAHDNLWGHTLSQAGIAYARVDVRGSGDSEGVLVDEYTEQELQDGISCISWLARQPWCNGNVGMRGISWGAINTLQIAARQPKSLQAILAIAGSDNRFTDDAHYLGGIEGLANTSWGGLFKTVMAGPPDPQTVGSNWYQMWLQRLNSTPAIITQWLDHADFDEYWQRGSVCLDYDAIQCPTYLVGGWADAYVNPIGRLLQHLNVPRKALIGRWGHTYPQFGAAGNIDWATEEIGWWQQHLYAADQKKDLQADPTPKLQFDETQHPHSAAASATGNWRALTNWPSSTTHDKAFSFYAGRLSPTDTADADNPQRPPEKATFTPGIPVGLCTPEWSDFTPAEQSADDLNALCFDSPPLAEGFTLLGYTQIHLSVATDNPNATLAVRLCDVDPSGYSYLVSFANFNLQHTRGADNPAPLTAGEFHPLDLSLRMAGHRFLAGHRIRVSLSEGLWPMTALSVQPGTLTFDLTACTLTLPALPADSGTELFMPSQPTADTKYRSPPHANTPTLNSNGIYQYKQATPWSHSTDKETGMTVGQASRITSELHPDRTQEVRFCSLRSWQQTDWICELEVHVEIETTPSQRVVREGLLAKYDNSVIFRQQNRKTFSTPR